MATIDEDLAKLTQADAQAKDRAAELAAAHKKIADLESAAVTAAAAAAAALAAAQANEMTPAQATALSAAADALVTATAVPAP